MRCQSHKAGGRVAVVTVPNSQQIVWSNGRVSNLSVVESDDVAASRFWTHSTCASVFVHPVVSKALMHGCRWFFLEKDSEPILMWPFSDESRATLDGSGFSYFFGPVWSDILERLGESTQHRLRAEGLYTMLQHLSGLTSSLAFEVAPDFRDLRPFLWWNELAGSTRAVNIEPRYTATISNLAASSDSELLAAFRTTRRQEVLRVAKSDSFYWSTDLDWAEVIRVYADVISRSGGTPDLAHHSLDGLRSLAGSSSALLLGSRESGSGELAAFSLILRGKNTSNLVLTGAASKFRRSGVGAWQTFRSIQVARDLGDDIFDFNGANSPRLGDDKHSYGAREQLFFRVRMTI